MFYVKVYILYDRMYDVYLYKKVISVLYGL